MSLLCDLDFIIFKVRGLVRDVGSVPYDTQAAHLFHAGTDMLLYSFG